MDREEQRRQFVANVTALWIVAVVVAQHVDVPLAGGVGYKFRADGSIESVLLIVTLGTATLHYELSSPAVLRPPGG